LSFFDETEETRRTPRPRRMTSSGSGGSRRPPLDQQTLLVRRLVAAGAVVLVIILLVVLVKGCVDSQRTQALKDYNRNVHSIVQESRSSVSQPFFQALSGASGQQATQVQETLNQLHVVAQEELDRADHLSVPGAMSEAQHDLRLLLALRRDAVAQVADLIQQAVGKSAAAGTAVNRIAGEMRAFDASDVIYSQRVAPLVLKGLKDDGISASYDGTAGEQVDPESSFLPEISWINPSFVAAKLGASVSGGTNGGKPAPGTHGHALDSVSVGGTNLDPSGSNQIPANPPPTFTVSFTNGGQNDETNVKVDVEISGNGAPITASTVVPSTSAGQQATATVQLKSSPPTSGPVTIKVTVEPVPGEQTTSNNSQTYNALFT
jgi:CARDB protein